MYKQQIAGDRDLPYTPIQSAQPTLALAFKLIGYWIFEAR